MIPSSKASAFLVHGALPHFICQPLGFIDLSSIQIQGYLASTGLLQQIDDNKYRDNESRG
ncbi:MAG: hypothetical protein CMH81_00130 [Nitrospiraceae bacterium]|nr:hypothetical protein [Nitrospiraceae bacterium]